jgi:hypothetical protein
MNSMPCSQNAASIEPADTLIPRSVLAVLGDPALISGEDLGAYYSLLGQLGAECGALGILDWIWVKDIADLTWQILRMRQWMRVMIENGQKTGLAAGIDQLLAMRPGETVSATANRLADEAFSDLVPDEHGRDGAARLSALLKPHGLGMHQIAAANSFFQQFKSISDAEALIANLEYRRDRALRQIEDRRQSLGSQLRSTVEGVIESPTAAEPVVPDSFEPSPLDGTRTANSRRAFQTQAEHNPDGRRKRSRDRGGLTSSV